VFLYIVYIFEMTSFEKKT